MGLRDSWNRFLYGDLRDRPAAPVGELRALGSAVPPYVAGRAQWPTASTETFRTQGYNAAPVVYSCVNARAKAVSSATLRVYRGAGGGQRKEVEDHPLRLLMQRPNPGMSEAEFLLMTVLLMDAAGFAPVEKVRSGAGRVVQLWHLRPDWIKPIPRDQAAPDWEYRVPGREPVTLKADDVVIVQGGPSLDLGYTGLSPIGVALREIGIENASTDFLKLFMDRGGVPQFVLTTPNVVKEQAEADAYRERWMQAYGSFRNWSTIGLLHGGMDIKQVGMNLDDMAYPELRRLTEAHICMAFGVPPIIIGSQVGLERSTYSNYAEARRTFHEDTVSPLWGRIDGALTRGLLPEIDPSPDVSLEFDTSTIPALRDDENAAWARATTALQAGGIMLDEFRTEVGLPPLPRKAGRLFLVPFSVTPMRPEDLLAAAEDEAAPPEPVPAALAPFAEGGGTEPKSPADPAADAEADAEGERWRPATEDMIRSLGATGVTAGEAFDRIGEAAARVAEREPRKLALTHRAAFERRANASRAQLAARGRRLMRAFWRQQGERVVAVLTARGEAGIPESRAAEWIDWDEEADLLRTALSPFHALVGEATYAQTAKTIGVDVTWDIGNPRIRQMLRHLAERPDGPTAMTATTRQDVARIVTEAQVEGATLDDIAGRIEGLFEQTYKSRSFTVARNETRVAANRAAVASYEESGVVMGVEILDNEAHTEDYGAPDGLSCAARNGLVVALELADWHADAEHVNGSLALAPVLAKPLGEI